MNNQARKIRRVTLSVELYDGTSESLEISDPERVSVNVDTPNQTEDFDAVMRSPYMVPVPEPLTMILELGRKGFVDRLGLKGSSRQQDLAMVGKAESQCGSCGAYRLDGRPPLVHQDGCPDAIDVGGVCDWWTHERIAGTEES